MPMLERPCWRYMRPRQIKHECPLTRSRKTKRNKIIQRSNSRMVQCIVACEQNTPQCAITNVNVRGESNASQYALEGTEIAQQLESASGYQTTTCISGRLVAAAGGAEGLHMHWPHTKQHLGHTHAMATPTTTLATPAHTLGTR